MGKKSRIHDRRALLRCRPVPYPLQSCHKNEEEVNSRKNTNAQDTVASSHFRSVPYPPKPSHQEIPEEREQGPLHKCSKSSEKEEWHDSTCSVCLEFPHNAILLVCSSHSSGCRPYMCATNSRYSNCFDRYKKGCTKLNDLLCPLCRGQIRRLMVIEPARRFFNVKERVCMQEKCSFIGTYKELRQHVRAVHPTVKPLEVDPMDELKWGKMVYEREREDAICTITSSLPGSVIVGDYVVFDDDEYMDDGFHYESS